MQKATGYRFRALLSIAALCLLGLPAGAAELADLRDRLDAAVARGDVAALDELLVEMRTTEGDLADYYKAYAHYRLGELTGDDKRVAKDHLNECIDIAGDVAKRSPASAEAHALKATCLGVSAPFYMLRAATRGMAANGAMDEALAQGPGNPRVILAEGISLYFRPSAFGGDKDKARARLEEALARFGEYQPASADAPVWGEAEAWVYIGRIARDAGDTEAARRAFEQALAITPGYRAAERELAAG
jgi:tetratricopeptide (TPR) repeat protein